MTIQYVVLGKRNNVWMECDGFSTRRQAETFIQDMLETRPPYAPYSRFTIREDYRSIWTNEED